MVGMDSKGKETKEPAITVDLWSVIAKNFPHKVGMHGCMTHGCVGA